MWAYFAIIFGAYLLGAFPSLYILGKLRGVDLGGEEDLHISLWRKVGMLEGTVGIVGDVAKGVIPVVVARILDFSPAIVAGSGLAAVVGQMWSVFSRFSGEKGNTTGLGMAVALTPNKALLLPLLAMAAAAIIRVVPGLLGSNQPLKKRLQFGSSPSRILPLGMIIGFALLPLSCWLTRQTWEITLACFILLVLIIIRRLTAGIREDLKTESNKKSILVNRLLYDRSYR